LIEALRTCKKGKRQRNLAFWLRSKRLDRKKSTCCKEKSTTKLASKIDEKKMRAYFAAGFEQFDQIVVFTDEPIPRTQTITAGASSTGENKLCHTLNSCANPHPVG